MVGDILLGVFAFCVFSGIIFLKLLVKTNKAILLLIVVILFLLGINSTTAINSLLSSFTPKSNPEITGFPSLPPENNPPLVSVSDVVTLPPAKKENNSNSNLIDCVGPDNREFKSTKDECTELNASWGKPFEEMINCNFSSNCQGQSLRLKRSECNMAVCCQLGNTWIAYASRDKCLQDQKTGSRSYSTGNYNYIQCIVTMPCTGKTYTYQDTKERCDKSQEAARYACDSSNFTYIPPTAIPTSSNTSSELSLEQQHKEACDRAAAEWIGLREKWEADNYNNYSSSAEAVAALEQYRQQYQNELYSAGCSNRISLY